MVARSGRRQFLKSSLVLAADLARGEGAPAVAFAPALAAGDVLRTNWRDDWQALPLGSGRFGGCFDAWGLQNVGRFAAAGDDWAPTLLLHKDHWIRNEYGRDNFDDVARVVWAEAPPRPATFRQSLGLLDGRLATECGGPGWEYASEVSFHVGLPDVLALRIRKRGPLPGLSITLAAGDAAVVNATGAGCLLHLANRNCATAVLVRVMSVKPAKVRPAAADVAIDFDGEIVLLVGVAAFARRAELERQFSQIAPAGGYFTEAAAAWRRRVGAGWIYLPDRRLQTLWARSLYYQLIGHSERCEPPAAACGLSGVKWRTHFPQDHSYVAPALLRLGHARTVAGWVEFYRRHLAWQQEITARAFRRASDGAPARGAMWSWLFPIGDGAEFIRHGAPNQFYYEIHNAAYPARMAWESARFLGEPDWLAETAWPVIEASARFYSSMLERGTDGRWGMHVLPSMGQDEFGQSDAADYLCALYTARYTLTIAVAAARRLGRAGQEVEQWRGILREGLAFERLRHRETGLLVTNRGVVDGRELGRQEAPGPVAPTRIHAARRWS